MSENNGTKQIVRTWITGKSSCTLVIPKDFAKDLGLAEPSHVTVERKDDGLIIKKLDLSEIS